jgi:hypothetical protein
MKRLLLPCLCLLVCAGTASAFDCSGAVPLTCNGPALGGTTGIPPELTFTHCGGTTPYKHKLYSLVLASDQEVTITLTGSAASFVEMAIFDGCNENACQVVSPPNSSVLPPICLEAGTYTVALTYQVDVVASYDISAACVSCEPVAAEVQAWGEIKAGYR